MSDSTDNQYLSNLKYDPNLERSPIAKYFGNIRSVMLMMLVVLITGIYSYISLPRELNPNIDIAIVVVSTVFPGANPEEVETLITDPIEDAIAGVDGITNYTSTS